MRRRGSTIIISTMTPAFSPIPDGGYGMNAKKYRCSECGAMEVVPALRGGSPLDGMPTGFVCRRCGHEYAPDTGISVINEVTVNTFPSPGIDLGESDPTTERLRSKRRTD